MTPDRVEDAEPWARGWRIPVSSTGRRLYLTMAGEGPDPLALFLCPEGGCAAEAAWLQKALAPQWPSLAYDRAGLGLSDPPDAEAASTAVSDLVLLLDRITRTRPPILVGLGHGGWIALQLAAREPDRVAGLVLVDVPQPTPDRGPVRARQRDRAASRMRLALARWGGSRALAALTSDPIGLPASAAEERRAILASPQHHAGVLKESADWPRQAETLRALPPPDRELPVAVVATARAGSSNHALQIAPAQRSRRGWVVTAAGVSLPDLMGPRRGQVTVEAIWHVRALIH